MLLPNAEQAVISESKTRGYLFDPSHRNNGGKWRLFAGLGYIQDNWQQFARDVREQHLGLDAVEVDSNDFAVLFKIEGELRDR